MAQYGPESAVQWAVENCGMLNGEEFTGQGELRVQTKKRIREDFARGRTVTVDGWVLSRTEAALCILAATTLRS